MSFCDECPRRCPHGECIQTAERCICTNPEPGEPSPLARGLVLALFGLLCIVAICTAFARTCDFSAVDAGAASLLEPENGAQDETQTKSPAMSG